MHTCTVPSPTITFSGLPANLSSSMLYAGMNFTLICRVQLVPEVNTLVNITTTWYKDGNELISSGHISVDSSATQSENNSVYLSMVTLDPLSNQDSGRDDGVYTCSVQVQDDTYITGSTSNGSKTLMVEGNNYALLCKLFN